VRAADPGSVALGLSAGHESPPAKAAMRATVLASDVAIFFPAGLAAAAALGGGSQRLGGLWPAAAVLLNPAAILIDHAHFQYNCISLGLAAAAAAAAGGVGRSARGGARVIARLALATALFCLAVNHKQMALYYAPALAGHVLGRCLQRPTVGGKVGAVAACAIAAACTFAAAWAPWWMDGGTAGVLAVLERLAPLRRWEGGEAWVEAAPGEPRRPPQTPPPPPRRGIFEDYVANFWCTTHVLIKWKRLFSQAALARAALALTALASLPAFAAGVARPSASGLRHALAASAAAFYLFSYQVHEKSVLLPLLPVTLLADAEPLLAAVAPAVAAFSMWPLLARDGVGAAYAGVMLVWGAVAWPERAGRGVTAAAVAAGAVAALLHAGAAFIPPPASLPWLWDAAITGACFPLMAGATAYLNWRLWRVPADGVVAAAPAGKRAAGARPPRRAAAGGRRPKRA